VSCCPNGLLELEGKKERWRRGVGLLVGGRGREGPVETMMTVHDDCTRPKDFYWEALCKDLE
jgi:hypothetical protein